MGLYEILTENKHFCVKIKELYEEGNLEKAKEICNLKRHIYSEILKGYNQELYDNIINIKVLTSKRNFNELLKKAKEYKKNNSDFNVKLNQAKQFKNETADFNTFLNDANDLKKNDNNFKKYLKNKTKSCDSGLYEYYETILNYNELIEFDFLLNSEIFLLYEECLCMNPC